MKAVVCQHAELTVRELPEPVPGRGQALLGVLHCGICGSDLHLRHHCDHMKALAARVGMGDNLPSSSDAVVFGHEVCGEVLDYGPGSRRRLKPGTRVVGQPVLRTADGKIVNPGLTPRANGAYAERLVMQEALLYPVPNGLSSQMAALTEPMAVGWHAIKRAGIRKKDVAIVIGCGPVGLAVICALKALGVATVVASDFSSGRRTLATQCGADVVIDPATTSPYASWEEYGFFMNPTKLMEAGLVMREKLDRQPLPWWHVWRVAEKIGGVPRPVIFECVGVPGVVQQIIDGAPLMSRVIVVGVCMQVDRYEPALAVLKEIELRFVINHTPLEFHDTLQLIAHGKFNCAPLLTGEVGLHGVDAAFTALKDPQAHAKILVDPRSAATEPVPVRL